MRNIASVMGENIVRKLADLSEGSSNRDVQQTSNGSSSGGSQGANRMGRSGRRKTDTSGEREIEVITLDDSSDGENLEEEAELIRLIQRRIGRKRSHVI